MRNKIKLLIILTLFLLISGIVYAALNPSSTIELGETKKVALASMGIGTKDLCVGWDDEGICNSTIVSKPTIAYLGDDGEYHIVKVHQPKGINKKVKIKKEICDDEGNCKLLTDAELTTAIDNQVAGLLDNIANVTIARQNKAALNKDKAFETVEVEIR